MKFPYGEANFYKIRTEGYFYVDKTRYIETLENANEGYANEVSTSIEGFLGQYGQHFSAHFL